MPSATTRIPSACAASTTSRSSARVVGSSAPRTSGPGSFPWPIFPVLFVGMRLLQVQAGKRDMIDSQREKLERKQLKQLEKRHDKPTDPDDSDSD